MSYKIKYECIFFFIFGPVVITGEGGGVLLQGNLVIKVKPLALCCRTIAGSDTSLSSVSFLLFLVFLKAKPSNYEKRHLPDLIVFPVISAANPPPSPHAPTPLSAGYCTLWRATGAPFGGSGRGVRVQPAPAPAPSAPCLDALER